MKSHRAQICDWLRANGINPNDVPIKATPTIADGQITIDTYARDGGGLRVVLSDLVVESTTVPLKVLPPLALERWVTGQVDGFGRPR